MSGIGIGLPRGTEALALDLAAGIWEMLLNNVVGLSILVIFGAALLTAFLRSRATDRCLKDFHRFHVTLERKDGKHIWGTLRVYSSGLELIYREPRQDPSGHIEASYIVYGTQYAEIVRGLYRFHDELTPANQRRRRRSARRTYRPNVFRRLGRWTRNILNTLRDAVVQSMSVVVGQLKKTHPGSAILAGQGKPILGVGSEVIGVAGNAFDPILERYVGKRVVLQVQTADEVIEYPGILKDYTAKFLEVLNIPVLAHGHDVPQPPAAAVLRQPGAAAPHAPHKAASPARPAEDETRPADIVVPRTVAVIRHAGPPERLGWRAFLGL